LNLQPKIKVKLPLMKRMNWPLIGGLSIALVLNGGFFWWLMVQPMPEICYEVSENLQWYFKVRKQPVPPFTVVDIKDETGAVIEKGFIVPTKQIPRPALPYPSTNFQTNAPTKQQAPPRKKKKRAPSSESSYR
jgi:hypothetical protein